MSRLPKPTPTMSRVRTASHGPSSVPPILDNSIDLPEPFARSTRCGASQVAARRAKRKSIDVLNARSSSAAPPPPKRAFGSSANLPPHAPASGANRWTNAARSSVLKRPAQIAPTGRVSMPVRPTMPPMRRQQPPVGVRKSSTTSTLGGNVSSDAGGSAAEMHLQQQMLLLQEQMSALQRAQAAPLHLVEPAVSIAEEHATQQLLEEVTQLRGELKAQEARVAPLEAQLSEASVRVTNAEAEAARLTGELRAARDAKTAVDALVTQMTVADTLQRAQLAGLQLENELNTWKAQADGLKTALGETSEQRDDLLERLRQNELLFRRMHNQIVDLKGNIRVMCRVRPLLASEATLGGHLRHIELPDADAESRRIELAVAANTASSSSNKAKPTYEFDFVFGQTATQAQIFEQSSELIQSALHGFNVCIIAYGQTGSGKTYTMEGAPGEQSCGLIPRAVQLIFDSLAEQEQLGWTYTFAASFVEIYTDELRDLLADGPPKKLDVKSAGKRVEVDGLSEQPIGSAAEAILLLQMASRNRQVFATKCNDRSSRSHAVFRLTMSGVNSSLGKSVASVLSLVDLAGSERLKESEAQGERLTETKSINRSLSALQLVISSQLANKDKEQHVPYRSNKLTLLLQDSLGAGSSKTLMLVTVSPLAAHAEETRRSLDFARQASRCNIGAARKA